MTKINWLEVAAYTVILLPFIAYLFAEIGIFFTKLESGDIKFIMRGDSLHKIICDVKGYKLDENDIIVPLQAGEYPKRRPWFGLYWIGIPPFCSIHHFPILKETPNPAGKTPEEWIKREKEETIMSSLHFTIPRPFVLLGVELGDRTPIDILVATKFEVVKPYIPIFLFKGKFFGNTRAIISGAVNDILNGEEGAPLKLDSFINAEKGEVGGILSPMKDPNGEFNKKLIEQVGLRLVGISIEKSDPQGEGKLREAMNAEVIAQQNVKAVIVTANGEAQRIKIEATAEAEAQKLLAEANEIRIQTAVSALASSGGDPNLVAQGTASILEMEAATRKNSQLTTLVKNGGAGVVIPVGGEGKK